jgi:hypothetical protein
VRWCVGATGVAIARAERRRRAYTPEEIRARLHARLTEPPVPTRPTPIPARAGEDFGETTPERIRRRDRLGGILHEYERAA